MDELLVYQGLRGLSFVICVAGQHFQTTSSLKSEITIKLI